jgi:ribosomal protein S1
VVEGSEPHDRNLPQTGDVIDVTVAAPKPFGTFVETESGVPGLVRGARAAVGTVVRVRVTKYEADESRSSATPAQPTSNCPVIGSRERPVAGHAGGRG